ncbi:MAG TPA: hypothetical protein H9681_12230, partial [Firmicutes bacterium]|nr:hypothetical protein [Bacillota bacterium]
MGESEHYDHCLTGDALRAASCDACRICFPPFGASPLTSENRCECIRLFNFRGFFDSTYLDNSNGECTYATLPAIKFNQTIAGWDMVLKYLSHPAISFCALL